MPGDLPDHYFKEENDTNRLFLMAMEETCAHNALPESPAHAAYEYSEELREYLYHLLDLIILRSPTLNSHLFELASLVCYGVTDPAPGVCRVACRCVVRFSLVCPTPIRGVALILTKLVLKPLIHRKATVSLTLIITHIYLKALCKHHLNLNVL